MLRLSCYVFYEKAKKIKIMIKMIRIMMKKQNNNDDITFIKNVYEELKQ